MKFILLFLLACGSFSTPAFSETFFNPITAAAMVERGEAILLDVREADEISTGMAEGAVWLPTSKIDANDPEALEFIASLDKNRTVIVYCGSGRRAAKFIIKLAEYGIKAENMGGFSNWVNANLPVVIPLLRNEVSGFLAADLLAAP